MLKARKKEKNKGYQNSPYQYRHFLDSRSLGVLCTCFGMKQVSDIVHDSIQQVKILLLGYDKN